ncbi:class I SAM-dependent methyltransferase [Cytobacillus horneckiae]|uniref:Class I SAM-dependent methyltransferase n=1 Tax=Cytobacillus horneckiae TaxID=549687 RepID=A0A2N0ZMB4_9BACI|nr:class I SAM-dependent methyltransferase [Cytobacillus horneckiae]MEC1155013.1 class I SAM-dependent methyltransferase [Cytobacillus horneckiae]MED2936081.1 class I SAM-dependent methyltransferase [Cytobacillus horneckiae]PKG30648.1 class I SAM-dependent methyltransferase [Cytobacillus horneckiae]
MKITPVEELFTLLNETADILREELDCTYLEALAETGENIFQESILQEELSELTIKRLKKSYESLHLDKFTNEDLRKSFQLAILKGMKESVQPNHQMTPDSIGMLVGYLVDKFVQKDAFSLLDPAVGTGNLLTTVMNHQNGKTVDAIGSEVDDLLIKLAYINANMQKHPIRFFNQDSLEPLFINEVDAVISDLPVGYYPNDIRAADYELKADEGHSYAHHLFIEQSLRHVKPSGYLFFIVPNGLFESEQSPKLHEYLKNHAIIQGLLHLPLSLFKNEQAAKSIFIIQKKGKEVKPPKQALLVNLPSLSKANEVDKILKQVSGWIKENKG